MLAATPSPAPRRLVKRPSRGTLFPKGERAGFSHRLLTRRYATPRRFFIDLLAVPS
jgi:hypothetical protein